MREWAGFCSFPRMVGGQLPFRLVSRGTWNPLQNAHVYGSMEKSSTRSSVDTWPSDRGGSSTEEESRGNGKEPDDPGHRSPTGPCTRMVLSSSTACAEHVGSSIIFRASVDWPNQTHSNKFTRLQSSKKIQTLQSLHISTCPPSCLPLYQFTYYTV